MTTQDVRDQVRQRYAKAALAVSTNSTANALALVDADQCCTPSSTHASCCGGGEVDAAFGSSLYSADEQGELPPEAIAASLGCGNPMAVADLRSGEKVLDLGSVEASMSCCRLAGWVTPGLPTAST